MRQPELQPAGGSDPAPASALDRRICPRCWRPRLRCLCRHLADLPPVPTRTAVFILQHPRERFHPLGTAQLVRLGLARAKLALAWDLVHPLALPPGTALLYPGPDARPIGDLPASERPPALLLLDGTWSQARKLYQRNPWLAQLPALRLCPDAPGRYRLRREPDAQALSTVEAAVAALSLLEPEAAPALKRLLDAFEAMIEQQMRVEQVRPPGGRQRRRPPPRHPLHASLSQNRQRLVLVYLEFAAGRLVHLAAMRLGDGQTLDRVVRPEPGEHDAFALSAMGLGPGELQQAVAPSQAREAWLELAGPRPLVAAWNQRTLALLDRLDLTPPGAQTLLLKAAYCNLGQGGGSLEDVLAREGLQPDALAVRGRAGLRLAQALAVARWLERRP